MRKHMQFIYIIRCNRIFVVLFLSFSKHMLVVETLSALQAILALMIGMQS